MLMYLRERERCKALILLQMNMSACLLRGEAYVRVQYEFKTGLRYGGVYISVPYRSSSGPTTSPRAPSMQCRYFVLLAACHKTGAIFTHRLPPKQRNDLTVAYFPHKLLTSFSASPWVVREPRVVDPITDCQALVPSERNGVASRLGTEQRVHAALLPVI